MKSKPIENKRIINLNQSEYIETVDASNSEVNIGVNYRMGNVGDGATVVQGDHSNANSPVLRVSHDVNQLFDSLESLIDQSAIDEDTKTQARLIIQKIKASV